MATKEQRAKWRKADRERERRDPERWARRNLAERERKRRRLAARAAAMGRPAGVIGRPKVGVGWLCTICGSEERHPKDGCTPCKNKRLAAAKARRRAGRSECNTCGTPTSAKLGVCTKCRVALSVVVGIESRFQPRLTRAEQKRRRWLEDGEQYRDADQLYRLSEPERTAAKRQRWIVKQRAQKTRRRLAALAAAATKLMTRRKQMSDALATYRDFLYKATDDDLWSELRACIASTSEGIMRIALIIGHLRERGVDVSGYLAAPLFRFLPAVAAGRLLPEVMLKFGHNDQIIALVQGLVVEEQRKVVSDNSKIELVVRTHGKEPETREVSPLDMSIAQARLAFGGGFIRSADDQKRILNPPALRLRAVEDDEHANDPLLDEAHAVAAECWRRWPGAGEHRQRRTHLEGQLRGSPAWSLMVKYRPRSLNLALIDLLDSQRPERTEKSAAAA